jgi:isocitrate dehydrogenase kinase/phosphatase
MNVDYIKKVSFYDYNKVCYLTENECGFFGYDKKEIDYKLFRKTLI